ncbi:MAG TPA: PilN domain-containing protein [Usitatibacter sp.]|nr:PilN domain-containing protein [Usitatibacter sp.]
MAATPEAFARPVPPWRHKLAAFWRWWTGELAVMLPERLARGTRVPVLAFEGDDVVLVEPRSAAGPNARVAAGTLEPGPARAAIRQLLERAGETRGRARLRLAREQALVRRVTMPAATEENLSQVVAFEMDRLTPFRADDVYFDHRVVSRDAGAGQILVEVAVAPRDVVDAAVARMGELGTSLQGVPVGDEASPGSGTLDLLPTERRGERETANERLLRNGLLAAVGLLLLVALLLPAWQKREAIVGMHPQIAKSKQEAESSDAIARTLEREVADYNFLLGKRHAPSALAYLEDVSRLLPDNTWVQQFELRTAGKGREVQITGETASASKLIEILEQSTLLQNSTPRGSVTRGSQPGTERFMIVAETRPRPMPESLPVREVAVLAPPPSMPAVSPAKAGAQSDVAPVAAAKEAADAGDEPEKAAPVAAAPPPVPAKLEPVPRPAQPPVARPTIPPDARTRMDERARKARETSLERRRIETERRRQEAAKARDMSVPKKAPGQ